MNKFYISVGVVLFTLCVIGLFNIQQQEPSFKQDKQPIANQAASRSQSEASEARPARRRSNARPQKTQNDDISESSDVEWVFVDPLSSTVTAVIQADESLVTGGYKTANGNYEMTIITLRRVQREDGREMIEIKSKIFSVTQEFVAENDLESITTNARNTLQHAEAWNSAAVTETLTSASTSEGANITSSPTIIAPPSSPFKIMMGHTDGQGYSLEGTIEITPDGGFSIESRIERQEEPNKSE